MPVSITRGKLKPHSIAIPFLLLSSLLMMKNTTVAQATPEVKIAGAMKNVMRQGELYGTIDLDTISNKKYLYGLGPVEFLKGEIMVIDGRAYKSTVVNDSTMNVEETFAVKAPFFVYANVENWKSQLLPPDIDDAGQLETYLEAIWKKEGRPFAFKLRGTVESAIIHVVDLPEGSIVRSPGDAHKGKKDYQLIETDVDIIGFYSKRHQGVFTHHDSYIHLHLVTRDKKAMGHLDEVRFKKGSMKLYLPE